MMRAAKTVMAFTSLLLLLAGCGPSEGDRESIGTKQTFSLCPKSDDAKRMLSEQLRKFAHRQNARLADRGGGATRELTQLNSQVLKNTGGAVILLTVDKPNEFRISVTNLGLKEKVGLSVRTFGKNQQNISVAEFLKDLDRFWVIREVDSGVGDDPPC